MANAEKEESGCSGHGLGLAIVPAFQTQATASESMHQLASEDLSGKQRGRPC